MPALHRAQVEVQRDPARFKVVAAGRRWGKGILGIGESVKRASQGKHCWWIAPTFASAAYQAGWRMLNFYATKIPGATLSLSRRALLINKGWVQFKTAEEPDSLRGESIDFAVVDEAAHVKPLQTIWELCLRPCLIDRKGCCWFITTPKGFNYLNDLYTRGRDGEDGWASFRFSSKANPHLDAKELEDIAKDMPELVRRQEIEAEFVQLAGALFKRDKVVIVEALPPVDLQWVRSWDLAFTQKTTSCFTVGLKAALLDDGTLLVGDVVRGRWEWPQALKVIAQTARVDGRHTRQGIEVVGAQVGALQTLLADKELAGIPWSAIEVHSDKITRSLPAVSRCENGKLAILRAPWAKDFLDELSAFPETDHDDQVDALSGALEELTSGSQPVVRIDLQDRFSLALADRRERSLVG